MHMLLFGTMVCTTSLAISCSVFLRRFVHSQCQVLFLLWANCAQLSSRYFLPRPTLTQLVNMCAVVSEIKFTSDLLIRSSAASMQQILTTSLWPPCRKLQHSQQVAACCSPPDAHVLQQLSHLLAQFFLPPRVALVHSSNC